MEHITIEDLRREIGLKRGEPLTDDEFKVLLSGFGAYCKRTGLYSFPTIRNSVSRGWMSAEMAHFFKRYAFE